MFRPTLEERKNYIAKIATTVFAERGYKTASLQDIAEKAEISKAGIYHYFKTKEEILYYIIRNGHVRFLQVLQNCIKNSEENKTKPEIAFKQFIVTYASFINNEKETRLIILRDRHQLTGKYKKGLYKMEREVFDTLKSEIKRLPRVSKKHDPNVISFLIISMSHWMGYWLKEKGKLSLESAIEQSVDIIFHGILKK